MTQIHKQWKELKALHPEALLLFRIFQSYYIFNEDALSAAKTLNLEIHPVPLFKNACRFNVDCLDSYLPRLIRAGNKVAIYEFKDNAE